MTTGAAWFLGFAAAVALVHWWAVAGRRRLPLLVTKPLVMLLLVGVALSLDAPGATRAWFVVALVLSLAGDVFLMLEPDQFVAGLASFLLAHLAYIIGLVAANFVVGPALAAVLIVAGLAAVIGRPIQRGARASDHRLGLPVAGYIAVISAMVVTAAATTNPVAAAGATSFYASDAVLGWNRFVKPLPQGRLVTMMTYHLGQTLLVVALATL